jgi:preprotein translocase subunit SecB
MLSAVKVFRLPDKRACEKGGPTPVPLATIADLQGIRLYSLTLQLGPQVLDPPYELGVAIDPSVETKGTELRYDISYSISGTKETAQVLALTCVYQASYLIPEDTQIEQADINAFGSTAVLLTLHPYLRELLADLSARAGLPPITLGTMRLRADAV